MSAPAERSLEDNVARIADASFDGLAGLWIDRDSAGRLAGRPRDVLGARERESVVCGTGVEGWVGMTNRPEHSPNEEANEVVYAFFEHFLAAK